MRKLRSEAGGSGLSTTMWIAAIGAVVYFGIMYVPPYVEAYQIKRVLREAANFARKDPNDDRVRDFIINKCKQIGSHYEIREGQERNIPGMVLLDDNIFIERDPGQSIVLQVEYDKHLYFPLTQKQKVLHFAPSLKGDLTPVKWD